MSENKTTKFLSVVQVGAKLTFELGNGKQVEFDANECGQAVKDAAMMHGFKQKIADSVAGLSKENKYTEAYAELADVAETLRSGEWFRRGGGNGGQIVADMAEAIAKLKKQPLDKVLSVVQKADAEQRKTWAKNPAVASEMAAIKAKRLKASAAGADAEGLEIEL